MGSRLDIRAPIQTNALTKWHYSLGRHPCTGMRVAKLEIKIVIALFLAGYEYDIVDEEGRFPKHLPKPNYNDIHQVCPFTF